jgi:DNA-binding beta-propeller fold protein YncE
MRFLAQIGALALTLVLAVPARAGDYALVGAIRGADGGWDFAAVDAATNRLFVARAKGVMAVDLATQKVTDILVEGEGVHGVLPVPGAPFALSANGKAATATLFDKTSGKVEASFPTGQGPDAIVAEPKSGLVLVFDGKSHDATLIDVATKSVAGAIALEGKPEVAAADGAGRVFVNLEDKNAVAVIDVAARKVVATYALNGCDAPTGLAYDAPTGLLIYACDNDVAKALDAQSGADVATLKIGKGPDGVLLDAARRRAFVPAADGTLTVLALGGHHEISVAETVATAPSAKTGAVDPATGKIYLPRAKMLPPEKEGARPKPEPGTFEILVVAPTR